jgi:endonuclease/exonuclease/phosphatase family metal-dependent hydrolase
MLARRDTKLVGDQLHELDQLDQRLEEIREAAAKALNQDKPSSSASTSGGSKSEGSAAAVTARDIPVLFAGDFNNYPGSPVYAHVTNKLLAKSPSAPLRYATPRHATARHGRRGTARQARHNRAVQTQRHMSKEAPSVWPI